MKAKVLKQLAILQFEVLAYTMKDYNCNTTDEKLTESIDAL